MRRAKRGGRVRGPPGRDTLMESIQPGNDVNNDRLE